MVHSLLRFITALRLRFFSIEIIRIVNAIVNLGAQPILEPNGNRNSNRVINLSISQNIHFHSASGWGGVGGLRGRVGVGVGRPPYAFLLCFKCL